MCKRYGFGTSYYQNHIKLKSAYFSKIIYFNFICSILINTTSKC